MRLINHIDKWGNVLMSPSFFDMEEGPSHKGLADVVMGILKESALDLSTFTEEVRDAVVTCMLDAYGFGYVEGMHMQKVKVGIRRKEPRKIKNEIKDEY